MIILLVLLMACIPKEETLLRPVLTHINNLPEILSENSGMTEENEMIWFINDSGNEPALYGYDAKSNEVKRSVIIAGAYNTDWEDVTHNTVNIFIGDFGNNAGNRNDLKIFMVNKTLLQSDLTTVAASGVINFKYEDQTNFSSAPENTSFDCEAFFATNDSIYLFTKDWVNFRTRIYSLPAKAGTFVAKFRKQLNVNGLITSATMSNSDNRKLLLLGYTPIYPFLWTFNNFDPDQMTYDEGSRVDFNSFLATQTEGILFSSNGTIYISSEAITGTSFNKPAEIFRIEMKN